MKDHSCDCLVWILRDHGTVIESKRLSIVKVQGKTEGTSYWCANIEDCPGRHGKLSTRIEDIHNVAVAGSIDGYLYVIGNGRREREGNLACRVDLAGICEVIDPPREARKGAGLVYDASTGSLRSPKLYLVGGSRDELLIERFEDGSWCHEVVESVSKPIAVEEAGVIISGQNIFLLGGTSKSRKFVKQAYKYQIMNRLWTPLSPMPEWRFRCGLCKWKQLLLLVGGQNSKKTCTTSIYIYDIGKDAWKQSQVSLTYRRQRCYCVVIQATDDSEVLVVIGGNDEKKAVEDVEVFALQDILQSGMPVNMTRLEPLRIPHKVLQVISGLSQDPEGEMRRTCKVDSSYPCSVAVQSSRSSSAISTRPPTYRRHSRGIQTESAWLYREDFQELQSLCALDAEEYPD